MSDHSAHGNSPDAGEIIAVNSPQDMLLLLLVAGTAAALVVYGWAWWVSP